MEWTRLICFAQSMTLTASQGDGGTDCFFAMFEMSLVNAYVIFRELNGKAPYKEFKRHIAMGLLTVGKDPKLHKRK